LLGIFGLPHWIQTWNKCTTYNCRKSRYRYSRTFCFASRNTFANKTRNNYSSKACTPIPKISITIKKYLRSLQWKYDYKYIFVYVYQWAFGIATFYRFSCKRFTVVVKFTTHRYARIKWRPFTSNIIDSPVKYTRFFFITWAALSVFSVRYDHVVGTYYRGGTFDFITNSSRRRHVAITWPARAILPGIIYLPKKVLKLYNKCSITFNWTKKKTHLFQIYSFLVLRTSAFTTFGRWNPLVFINTRIIW